MLTLRTPDYQSKESVAVTIRFSVWPRSDRPGLISMVLEWSLYFRLATAYPDHFDASYVPTAYDVWNIRTTRNPFIVFREMVGKIGATVDGIDLEERRVRAEAVGSAQRKLLQAHVLLQHLMVVRSLTRTTSTRTIDSYRWEHDQEEAPLYLEGVMVLKTTMAAMDILQSVARDVPEAAWDDVAQKMMDTMVEIDDALLNYTRGSEP